MTWFREKNAYCQYMQTWSDAQLDWKILNGIYSSCLKWDKWWYLWVLPRYDYFKNIRMVLYSDCQHLWALQNTLVINLIFALKFGLFISIRPLIWYIKVHNIPSSLLSLTSLSSHLKHLIILIFLKLAQFSQYMHCNPFLYHAMLAPFQSYLNFLETLDCLWNWFLIFSALQNISSVSNIMGWICIKYT